MFNKILVTTICCSTLCLLGCDEENETPIHPTTAQTSLSSVDSPSVSTEQKYTYADYYDITLDAVSSTSAPIVMPSIAKDKTRFVDMVDVQTYAGRLGIKTLLTSTRDNAAITEFRSEQEDNVIRLRRDKQSLRFYFADRRTPVDSMVSSKGVSEKTGVRMAESMFGDLGLPAAQKGEITTDTIELAVIPGEVEKDSKQLSPMKRLIDSRVVHIGRQVENWKVFNSKLIVRISNAGEVISGRINWPAFEINPKKVRAQARDPEAIAAELANRLKRQFNGRKARVSSEPEIVWKPVRVGMNTYYEPAIHLIVSSHAAEDPVVDEVFVDVY